MASATWSIIKPQAATNYLTNPSMELGASTPTNWTLEGVFGTPPFQETAYTWRGQYNSHMGVNTGYAGIYQDVSGTNGQSYTCSVYMNVISGSAGLFISDYGGVNNSVSAVSSGTGWQRITVTKVAANNGLRFRILSNNGAANVAFDAAQCEDGSSATTYIDGTMPGCYWTGAAHLSTSTRDGQSREGGLLVPLTNYFKSITSTQGAGMLTVNNASLPLGLQGGEIYQRTTPLARRMIFTGVIAGTSKDDLHTKRQALIDLTKADLVTPQQSFWMVYNDGVKTTNLFIKCVYESGLEYNADNGEPDKYEVTVPLRVVCHDPYFYSEQALAQTLGYSSTVTNANYILQRVNGTWAAMGTGASAGTNINVIVYNPVDGYIYAGGGFTAMSGVANTNCIAKWNGTTWSAVGAGANNGTIYSLVVDAAGNVYAGGSFTQMSSVANTAGIAKWNGSAWSALGAGGSAVYAMCIDNNGILYAGGSFAPMGGVANTTHIASWNGSTWSALGTGANDNVMSLCVDSQNNVYAGGYFTLVNSVTNTASIAKWNGSAWSALGTGANGYINALTIGIDGALYAGGVFTTAGGVSANKIAKWNGTAWSPLGTGTSGGTNTIYALATNPKNGNIYVSGSFTAANGVTTPDSIAFWTGSTFIPIDAKLPSSPAIVYTTAFDKFGNLFIGFATSGSATSATVTASSNASSKSYPILYITGVSGVSTIYQLLNYTTGRGVWFNNLTVQAGETVRLDLRPGYQRVLSYWRGEINNGILQGSRDDDWFLQPGSNNVSCYATGGTANIWINWRGTFNSFDGVTV